MTVSRLDKHSQKIDRMEIALVKIASAQRDVSKTLEKISNKIFGNGNKGMDEEVRILQAEAENAKAERKIIRDTITGIQKTLIEIQNDVKAIKDRRDVKREVKLMGVKTTMETRMAIINGCFILAGILLTWFLNR